MLEVLERKLKQMHAALGAASSFETVQLSPVFYATEGGGMIDIDFNGGTDPIQLANAASLMIANIASLKDHLQAWCKRAGVPSPAENVLNHNRSVSLIHDLWNIDKHAELNRPPRSGTVPKLVNLRRFVVLPAGAPSGAEFRLEYQGDNQFLAQLSPTGAGVLRFSGQIVDGENNVLGDFYETCQNAAAAWAQALAACDVPTSEI